MSTESIIEYFPMYDCIDGTYHGDHDLAVLCGTGLRDHYGQAAVQALFDAVADFNPQQPTTAPILVVSTDFQVIRAMQHDCLYIKRRHYIDIQQQGTETFRSDAVRQSLLNDEREVWWIVVLMPEDVYRCREYIMRGSWNKEEAQPRVDTPQVHDQRPEMKVIRTYPSRQANGSALWDMEFFCLYQHTLRVQEMGSVYNHPLTLFYRITDDIILMYPINASYPTIINRDSRDATSNSWRFEFAPTGSKIVIQTGNNIDSQH